jgi:hypothetical protein
MQILERLSRGQKFHWGKEGEAEEVQVVEDVGEGTSGSATSKRKKVHVHP